ncbi:MAG TPA: site-2 protease family protein [Candidatus Limnocylindrales bacterium]|nr:site-2 protease family protein [Candidatus Limnocylindrales bacterium]
MRWSWQIARVAGIPIRVHATFLLLVGWVFVESMTTGRGVAAALEAAGFVLAVFACIVLHELGHALTARRYGIRTRDITLLPIGGLARLERIPERPRDEILVALAGPAVNVAIAACLLAILTLLWHVAPSRLPLDFSGGFLPQLFAVNIYIVLFNMIPAFPMDGGRVLRALLATRIEYLRATQIAAGIGQGIAVVFAILAIKLPQPYLFLIALFVFLAAGQEASLARMRSAFRGVPVSRAMITDFRSLRADEPLTRAVELLLDGHQQDFPVLAARDGDPPVGILTRRALLTALAEGPRDRTVGEIAGQTCGFAHPREFLEDAFQRMERSRCPALLVISERGEVVGMLTLENVGELAMVQAALDRSPGGRPGHGVLRSPEETMRGPEETIV